MSILIWWLLPLLVVVLNLWPKKPPTQSPPAEEGEREKV